MDRSVETVRTGSPSVFDRDATVQQGHPYLEQALYTIVIVVSFSLFVALAKGYLRMPLHIPGHSALYVIPLMLLGRTASKNRLGGTGIGGLSGLMMATFGLGGGFFLGIPRYLFMGAVIDVLLWKGFAERGVIHMVAAGALANFAKLFVGLIVATLVGIPAFFIQLGMTYSVVTHLTFGAMGGLLAFGAIKAFRRMQNQRTTG
jgi:hypothetical protein